MITINRTKDTIEINGHANYADEGKDIVCASISVLAQTLVASVEELTEDVIEYELEKGHIKIKFWSLSELSKTLVDSFFIGVNGVCEAYPDYVEVKE